MTYSEKDLARAHATLFGDGTYEQRIAELIATVRRETVEECARVADDYADRMDVWSAQCPTAVVPQAKADAGRTIAGQLLALLDEPKAEPLCGRCGGAKTDPLHNTWVPDPLHHNFKPEEPGHE